MYRSEIAERIGARLKRLGVNPIARNSITTLVMEEFKDILNEQIDCVIEVALLTLHEDFGFGAERCDKVVKGMSSRVDTYYDSYGLDTLIKFQMQLKEAGINYSNILDQRKEQSNGK